MKYNYLVLDLDGTVLSFYKNIRKSVYLSLKKYSENGGKIIIATGKHLKGAMTYIKLIEEHAKVKIQYLAALNGNIVMDLFTNKLIYSKSMDEEVSHNILDICKSNKVAFFPHTVDGIENSYIPIHGFKFLKAIAFFNSGMATCKVSKVMDKLTAYKICVINNKFSFKGFDKAIKEIHDNYDGKYEISATSHWLTEIYPLGSNKGNAVKLIAELEGAKLENFAAIGDSANDISMFKVVGLPIACYHNEKKYNKVKDYVKLTVYDNNYCHVAKAITNYLLT